MTVTEEKKEPSWKNSSNWVRTADGRWLNVKYIKEVYIDVEQDKFSIMGVDECRPHTFISGFESREAAQQYLDTMRLFYEER